MSKRKVIQPKAGDKFFPDYASELDALPGEPEYLTITTVEERTAERVWLVTASDGELYECIRHEGREVWCYTLT